MSSLVSTVKGIAGIFGGRGGGVKAPKKQKELGRMSLSELTELRESLTGQITPLEGILKEGPSGEFESLKTIGTRRIRQKRAKQQLPGLQGRLGEISSQIQKLTRQRVGSRTARATAVSTLLGRRR